MHPECVIYRQLVSEIPSILHLFDRNRIWSFTSPSLLLISLACSMFFQKSSHIETLTFGKRRLHPVLQSHLRVSVPD